MLGLGEFRDEVDPEACAILAEGHTEGTAYYLPARQLARKLYEEVNEVLVRLGGKWNRKQKAHLFEHSPQAALALVIEGGCMPAKNRTAYYFTPQATAEFVAREALGTRSSIRRILEPSAGKGHLLKALQQSLKDEWPQATIECCEIRPDFCTELQAEGYNVVARDFLHHRPSEEYDLVVMNPPYALADDPRAYVTHVLCAWLMVRAGGRLVAVVPAGFEQRQNKRDQLLAEVVQQYGRVRPLPANSFKEAGTGVNTCVIVLDRPA